MNNSLSIETLQEFITQLAKHPTRADLILLQVSRRSVAYGTPEYELLDRVILHNCYSASYMPFGPRLSNGMFLSMGKDAE